MNKRILVVRTSVEKYPNLNRATGLWLGEARGAIYKKATKHGRPSQLRTAVSSPGKVRPWAGRLLTY